TMNFFTTTCDVYRPFGAGAPTEIGIPCRLVPNLNQVVRGAEGVSWTHYIDLPAVTDTQDRFTRAAPPPDVRYANGHELRGGPVRSGGVWVELHMRGGAMPFRRA